MSESNSQENESNVDKYKSKKKNTVNPYSSKEEEEMLNTEVKENDEK